MQAPEPDDARELLALERLIRRADGFALAFARVNAPARRRELTDTLRERLGDEVRVVPVAVAPETTDLESLLARRYAEEAGEDKVALFVVGVERVLSAVRERNGFLPVLNYKRENLQRSVPCPVVVWLPEFALRLVATGAPDVWAWRSGVFEFAMDHAEAEQAWATLHDGGTVDEYARLTPDERRARIEMLEALYHDYNERDGADEISRLAILADLADRLGRLYQLRPDLPTALEWSELALKLAERALGPNHPDTLTPVNNLGIIRHALGDFDGAEALYHRALETRVRVLGPDHPDTLTSVNNMGFLLRARGEFEVAARFYIHALEARKRVLGPDHPDTLASTSNLGSLLFARGDFEGAERLQRQALGRREQMLGTDHPDTFTSVNNLGAILRARGDLGGAEVLARQALEGVVRVLGSDHPNTIAAKSNLGHLLYAKGDYDGSEYLIRSALDGAERVFGCDHPRVSVYRDNLAGFLAARERTSVGE